MNTVMKKSVRTALILAGVVLIIISTLPDTIFRNAVVEEAESAVIA